MTTDTREFYLLDMEHKPKAREHHGEEDDEEDDHDEGPPVVNHGAPLMVWWGPNGSGYGNSLVLPFVGKYTAADIQRRFTADQIGTVVLPIPCEVAERFALPRPDRCMGVVGSYWCDGPGPVVLNHAFMWDLLEPLAWRPGGGT